MATEEKRERLHNEIMLLESKFQGYTIEQLKYQRALLALKKEFMKEKMMGDLADLQKKMTPPSLGELVKGESGKISGTVARLLGKLNYLDLFIIGFTVFGKARKVASLFRKKRK